MAAHASLPPAYFDAPYAKDADPWRFASSDYERAKYDATMAALPAHAFAAAFEVGCSIGLLTRRLAGRCAWLLAVDVADAALAQARARCSGLDHVEIRRMRIPQEWPDGAFDLIVLSEVLSLPLPRRRRAGGVSHAGLPVAGRRRSVGALHPADRLSVQR